MYLRKLLTVAAIAVLCTGCACRRSAGGIGSGDDNIPLAEAGDILKDVNFAFDSYALNSEAKSILEGNASWLKENTSAKVQVEGHCDERGTNEYNMALGQRRAQSSADYLSSLGVDRARISTISYGEEIALDPNHNEAAWSKNRRAHFKILQ